MSRTEARTQTFAARTAFAGRLILALTSLQTRRRERQSLARLDDRMLRDIGVEPETAAIESGKPFWQP